MNTAKAFLFSLLFIPLLLLGQNESSLNWGPDIPRKKNQERPKIVAQLDDSFIALRRFRKIEDKKGRFYNDQFELLKYDNSGNLLKKNILALKGIPQNPENLYLLHLRNELLAFYEYYHPKQKAYVWEKRNIEVENLNFKEEAKEISRTESKEELNQRSYTLKASASENFLVFFRENWNHGESKRIFFRMMVFDQNFTKILDKDIQREVEDRSLGYSSFTISDQGEVYLGLLIKAPGFGLFVSKAKIKERRTGFRLYQLAPASDEVKSYSLNLSGMYIAQMEIQLDERGQVFGKGLYGEYFKQAKADRLDSLDAKVYKDIDSNAAHGVITFREEDLSEESISPKIQAFTIPFNADNIPQSRVEKNLGLHDFLYQKISQGKDSYILLEKYKSEIAQGPHASYDMGFGPTASAFTGFAPSSQGTEVITQLKNIILLKLSPEGKIEWHKTLPKFQRMGKVQLTEQKWSYGSLGIIEKKGQLVLAFNDGPINYQHRENAWTYSKPDKMEMISLLKIDSKGELRQEIIEEAGKPKFKLVPNCFSSYESPKNRGIYYAENGKTYKWGFLK